MLGSWLFPLTGWLGIGLVPLLLIVLIVVVVAKS